jgi:hypothetical protein
MDEMALAHRYRFVAPLCAGRIVRDLAGASAHRGALAEALGFSETEADIVLALAAPADVLTSVTGLIGSLRPDGRLVLAFPDESGTALRSTLAARFRFVATYIQRPVLGSIVASSRFAESRAAMLVDAAPAAARGWTILVCGETADNLTCGLFEAPLPDVPPPLRPPVERAARSHDSGPIAARDIARADAVSLVDRLMDLDQAIFALGAENRELRERIATARSAAPTDGTAACMNAGPTMTWWPARGTATRSSPPMACSARRRISPPPSPPSTRRAPHSTSSMTPPRRTCPS